MVYLTLKFFFDFLSKLDMLGINDDEKEILKQIEYKIMLMRQ